MAKSKKALKTLAKVHFKANLRNEEREKLPIFANKKE